MRKYSITKINEWGCITALYWSIFSFLVTRIIYSYADETPTLETKYALFWVAFKVIQYWLIGGYILGIFSFFCFYKNSDEIYPWKYLVPEDYWIPMRSVALLSFLYGVFLAIWIYPEIVVPADYILRSIGWRILTCAFGALFASFMSLRMVWYKNIK